METSLVLIGAGISLAVLELALGGASGFDLLLVGLALALGGLVGQITGNEQLGLLIATLLTLLYFFLLRKIVRERLNVTKEVSNIDLVLDKRGIVTKEIGPDTAGQVKVGAEVWRAESKSRIDTLKKGETIKVVSVSGVTLIVEKTK